MARGAWRAGEVLCPRPGRTDPTLVITHRHRMAGAAPHPRPAPRSPPTPHLLGLRLGPTPCAQDDEQPEGQESEGRAGGRVGGRKGRMDQPKTRPDTTTGQGGELPGAGVVGGLDATP